MIQITCPSNNIPERTYAIEALLSDVMGCEREEYNIVFKDETKDYVLQYDNKTIVVEDHFFNRYLEPLSYLHVENIPTGLSFFHALGLEIPIVYGEDRFVQEENNIVIGLDVFASTFFMLTRWEESLLGREEKGDCDENQLFSVRQGFHDRPIVNEYADLLYKLLLGSIKIRVRKYKVVLSHDVDSIITPSWGKIIKDIYSQTRFGEPKNKLIDLTWREKIKYKMAFPNAFSQFKMYKDLAKKYNIEEWFYVKVCAKGEKEATYWYNDKVTLDVVEWLKKEKSNCLKIGFHPSQSVLNNKKQWDKEVKRITNLLGETPIIGRNHHLLYNEDMLRWWEELSDNPVNISDCVFHKNNGFRSGVCNSYHIFDFINRRTMRIIEHPNQVMDTVIRYDGTKKSEGEIWDEIKRIISHVKKYDGELVVTWHIYIRIKKLIQDYYKWCEKVIENAVR